VKKAALFVRHGADRDSTGNIRGTVDILAAGIDQEHRAIGDGQVAFGGDAIVHDRGMLARAGDGVEGNVLQRVLHPLADIDAAGFELFDGGNLGDRSGLRAVEPGEEFDHGGAVLEVGAGRAFKLSGVLASARQAGGVDCLKHRAAADADAFGERERGMIRIDHDCFARCCKRSHLVFER
jgi:hypothetical protein